MKKILFLILLISISFASEIVLTHANYFDINTKKYIYDSNITLCGTKIIINQTNYSKDAKFISIGGRYVFPGFFLSYIDAIDYPNLDLWTDSGVTGAFSYSKSYYYLSRIASKDPSTLINKSLITVNYQQNACDLTSSSIVFDTDNLTEQYVQYSIFLRNPKFIVVDSKSIKYLPMISKITHRQKLTLIVKISNLMDFKTAVENKAEIIIGLPTKKINFKFSNYPYIITNLTQIEKKYSKNPVPYKNALYNLDLIHKNNNKILLGNFSKIGIPYREIDKLSKVLTPKDIILSMTEYPFEVFNYSNKKDLLIFNEDPIKNTKNLKSLTIVVKNCEIANIARGSVDYFQNANLNLSKSIQNTKLFLMTSIYPVLSFEKKMVGLGNDLYFPQINTNIYYDLFLGKGYNFGTDFGVSYKNYYYDYTYLMNHYEKRSLYFQNDNQKIGYYGEYVLNNPFSYPEYDSGLFENLFYKNKNANLLFGYDRLSGKSYFKSEVKCEKKSSQDVKFFAGFSDSNFYQYKINMGNLKFFDNYQKTSQFLFSFDIEKDLQIIKNIISIPVGTNVYLYDKGLGIYFYTGLTLNKNISTLIMSDFESVKFKIIFNNFDFK